MVRLDVRFLLDGYLFLSHASVGAKSPCNSAAHLPDSNLGTATAMLAFLEVFLAALLLFAPHTNTLPFEVLD